MQAHASRSVRDSVGFVEDARPSGYPHAAQGADGSGTTESGEDQRFHEFT